MSFLPIPDYAFRDVTRITPAFLTGQGIRFLLLDLDNTLAPYGVQAPAEAVRDWAAAIRKAGITPFLVSNNRGRRPELFSAALEMDYVKRAGKPGVRGMRAAMERLGAAPEETALAGDQIYTDAVAAKRCGVRMLLVRPIRLSNPLLAVRYALEMPFRLPVRKINTEEDPHAEH